jgi:hypothetical protein
VAGIVGDEPDNGDGDASFADHAPVARFHDDDAHGHVDCGDDTSYDDGDGVGGIVGDIDDDGVGGTFVMDSGWVNDAGTDVGDTTDDGTDVDDIIDAGTDVDETIDGGTEVDDTTDLFDEDDGNTFHIHLLLATTEDDDMLDDASLLSKSS